MRFFGCADVTEIGKDPGKEVLWIDTRSRGLVLSDVTLSDRHTRSFLNRVADANGQLLNADTPRIEAALPKSLFKGARLSGHVPPVVPRSVGFTIRIPEAEAAPLESFRESGSFTPSQYDALLRWIETRRNVAIVGGTSTGKTYLLNSILRKIGELHPAHRIVTIEQVPEIIITHSWSWYPLTTRTEDGYLQLVEDSMRLSPKRLVGGESRGRGILALLDAFNSGHDGGLFTFHSNTAEKALRRIYNYCRRDSDTDSHKETIGDAVQAMIVLDRDGPHRFVREMYELDGYSTEEDRYRLTPVA